MLTSQAQSFWRANPADLGDFTSLKKGASLRIKNLLFNDLLRKIPGKFIVLH